MLPRPQSIVNNPSSISHRVFVRVDCLRAKLDHRARPVKSADGMPEEQAIGETAGATRRIVNARQFIEQSSSHEARRALPHHQVTDGLASHSSTVALPLNLTSFPC